MKRDVGVINQQNEVNKEGSRVIHVCNPVPTSFQAYRVTYDSLFTSFLLIYHPYIPHEMIFTLVALHSVPLTLPKLDLIHKLYLCL